MLELHGLHYSYPGSSQPAVQGVSLRVPAGTVTAILGQNGAGKSTVMGLAAGWLAMQEGERSLDGQAAYLPQSERLAFAFTCLEYVLFGRAPHLPYLAVPRQDDESLAWLALERTGMAAMANRRIGSLSGGELQLVRLARCIAQDAGCLILDEPTDMLDPAHVVQIGLVLRQLAAKGRAVLFSSHDLGFALAYSDQAVLLRHGQKLADGPAREVIEPERLSQCFGVAFGYSRLPSPLAP